MVIFAMQSTSSAQCHVFAKSPVEYEIITKVLHLVPTLAFFACYSNVVHYCSHRLLAIEILNAKIEVSVDT